MAKNILQDIVPPEKKSIRNIPVPNRGVRATGVSEYQSQKVEPQKTEPKKPFYDAPIQITENPDTAKESDVPRAYPYDGNTSNSGGRNKKIIWGSIIVAVLIIAFAVSSLFSGATVSVVPTETTLTLATTTVFTAQLMPAAGSLGFQVIKITKDAGKDISATGTEQVARKASGTIVVYNNYNANDQRLIKNTRFATPEGLVFRINDSIVVPGKKTVNGVVVPGSIETLVYADVAGDTYNIGKTDFTIPGFKGDPRFTDIYARSKTEMTGGFVGTVKTVSDADAASAKQDIDSALGDELKKEALAQVPADSVLFDDGIFLNFTTLPQSGDQSGSTATLNEEGTLYGIMFKKPDLAQSVAQSLAPDVLTKGSVDMSADSAPVFALNDRQTLDPSTLDTISFTLNGPVNLISQFDETRLKADLAGQPKSNLTTILASYPAIKQANAVIRPVWKSSFPTNPADITVSITP